MALVSDVPEDDFAAKKTQAEAEPRPALVTGVAESTPGHRGCLPTTALLADRYLLVPPTDSSSLNTCIDVVTGDRYACRVVERGSGRALEAEQRVEGAPGVRGMARAVLGLRKAYLLYPPSYGDLHSYVRTRRRLREPEARRLFRQVASAVASCHSAGLVLRDLKLRKFVFVDPERTELKLESLEDAVVLEDEEDDILGDKRGCPAYVSPEILRSNARYSGRAADVWSLGVILYTMLVGRYPFHDTEHLSLFWKISRGQFVMPECVSAGGRCLIRSLLRREPSERLSAQDVLLHPWLRPPENSRPQHCCQHAAHRAADQVVPSID